MLIFKCWSARSLLFAKHGIEDGEELSHAGGECDLGAFTGLAEALVVRSNGLVGADGAEGGHVEAGADGGARPPRMRRWPRDWPLSQLSGAGPERFAAGRPHRRRRTRPRRVQSSPPDTALQERRSVSARGSALVRRMSKNASTFSSFPQSSSQRTEPRVQPYSCARTNGMNKRLTTFAANRMAAMSRSRA